MKKNLRHLWLLLVGVLITFSAQQARATHAIGADMNYVNVAPGVYYVQYRFYRDCGGSAQAPTSAPLQYEAIGCGADSSGTVSAVTQNLPLRSYDVGNPYCGRVNVSTPCDSAGGQVMSTFPNYQVYTYVGIVTLGSGPDRQCQRWRLSVTINARPNSANLVNAGASNLYSLATFNNRVVLDDSSPAFPNSQGFKPLIFTCDSSTQYVGSPVTDPDNLANPGTDSLVYSLQQPLANATGVVAYTPGYSIQNPMRVLTGVTVTPEGDPVIPFSLNPNTGEIGFTSGAYIRPAPLSNNLENKYAFVVQVDSYRRLGRRRVKISTVRRDIVAIIFNCNPRPNAPLVDTGDSAVVSSGVDTIRYTLRNDTIDVDACANTQVDVNISDINGDSIFVTIPQNQLPSQANIQVLYDNFIPGLVTRVRARLIWVPDSATVGGYYPVTLSIVDNGCPIPGSTTQTLVLHVVRNQYADVGLFTSNNNGANDTLCVGQITKLVASTRLPALLGFPPQVANYNYIWLPDPDNTIVRTNGDTAVVRPLRTTRYHLIVKSPQRCEDTTSIVVRVDPANRATAQPDTICRGATSQLNVQGRTRRVGPGGVPIVYTYRWVDSAAILNGTPTTLSNDSIHMPGATPLVTTRYYATVYSSLGCTDTASVLVVVDPTNVATATTQSDSVCRGQAAQLSVRGRSQTTGPGGPIIYSYRWVDSTAIRNGTPTTLANDSIQEPLATPLVTTRYYATVFSSSGCTDTASVLVVVDAANIAVAIAQTDSVCPGQPTQLSARSRPQTTGPNGQTIIYSYRWVDSTAIRNGTPSTLNEPTIQTPTASPQVTTRYYATVFSSIGCTDTASVVVYSSGPYPEIDLASIATQQYPRGQELVYGQNNVPSLRATNDDGRFRYSIRGADLSAFHGDTTTATPTVRDLDRTSTFTLVVTNANGCQVSESFTIQVPLYVPNIITPNNDGKNDRFVIDGLESASLTIYNRWGRKVKEWDSYDNKWDGDDQSAGTYYYLLRTKGDNKEYKGWLEIVK